MIIFFHVSVLDRLTHNDSSMMLGPHPPTLFTRDRFCELRKSDTHLFDHCINRKQKHNKTQVRQAMRREKNSQQNKLKIDQITQLDAKYIRKNEKIELIYGHSMGQNSLIKSENITNKRFNSMATAHFNLTA